MHELARARSTALPGKYRKRFSRRRIPARRSCRGRTNTWLTGPAVSRHDEQAESLEEMISTSGPRQLAPGGDFPVFAGLYLRRIAGVSPTGKGAGLGRRCVPAARRWLRRNFRARRAGAHLQILHPQQPEGTETRDVNSSPRQRISLPTTAASANSIIPCCRRQFRSRKERPASPLRSRRRRGSLSPVRAQAR